MTGYYVFRFVLSGIYIRPRCTLFQRFHRMFSDGPDPSIEKQRAFPAERCLSNFVCSLVFVLSHSCLLSFLSLSLSRLVLSYHIQSWSFFLYFVFSSLGLSGLVFGFVVFAHMNHVFVLVLVFVFVFVFGSSIPFCRKRKTKFNTSMQSSGRDHNLNSNPNS